MTMKTKLFLFVLFLFAIKGYSQNNCLEFHSVLTDVASRNYQASFNPTDVITVEAMINADTWRTSTFEGSIVATDGDVGFGKGYALRCGNNGNLSFVLCIGGAWIEAQTTTNPMSTGTWYHVAGVYNGSTIKLYINGTQVASTNITGAIVASTNNFEIGRGPQWTDRYFDGKIDEVRLWHAALDQGIIDSWKNKTITSCHPQWANMIAYFELNDNSPTNVMYDTKALSDASTSVSGASYIASTSGIASVTGFQQTTASQPNTAGVSPGTTSVEVLKIEVEVYSTINATEFRLRTDGTTNIADITNAKLWYTGASSTFATTTQFGSTVAVPPAAGVDMVFSGTQALSCGKNYFWLTYDVTAGATVGNVIDGYYQSAVVGGVSRTPVTNAPVGSRPISNSCTHTIRLTDTFGDGWNGGTVTVTVGGVPVLTNITLGAGTGPQDFTFSASSGSAINVTRTAPGTYPGEMRVQILDGSGATILALTEPTNNNAVGSCPGLMSYVSCTTTQSNTSSVVPGTTNAEVIGIQIVTSGTISPFTASSFTFNTTGTSSPLTDISNARLWTTGTSSTFATTTQLGTVVAAPNGSFTVTGGANMPYTLSNGTNYFWLTYDVQGTATLGNVIDAQCTSLTANGIARTPATTNPAGSRPINIVYCSSSATSTGDEEIFNVTFGTLNNTSSCATTGGAGSVLNCYSNYTALAAPSVATGATVSFSVQVGTCGGSYSNAVGIWIDYNIDGDFSDAGEQVYSSPALTSGAHTETGNIVIPVTATSGNTRMRVMCIESTIPADPCASYTWGETEDYTINIQPPVAMSLVSCTTEQNNISTVNKGTNSQEIICVKIVTSGTLSPLTATNFIFNTTGTSAPLTDITNAKLWTTGTSSTFATSTQLGNTIAAPNGVYSFAMGAGLPYTLSAGTNYFWITYDIPLTATTNNNVDAQCTSVSIGGTPQVPAITAPAGVRKIADVVTCTNLQPNVQQVPRGTNQQEIFCMKVENTGIIAPLNITSFVINMNGSTNLTTDVSNVRIYYTGSNSTFSATGLFGSVAPAAGSLTVSGSQLLLTGTNYFWIAYDIKPTATLNNYVDAQCTQITFDNGVGNKVPSPLAPSGRRKIIDLVGCVHTLKLYDFYKASNPTSNWGTDFLDVYVDGVQVIAGATLGAADANGKVYTFTASEGQTIITTYTGTSANSKYVITGAYGDWVMDDGTEWTIPTGKTGRASCVFIPKFTINGNGYFNGEPTAKSNVTGNNITLTDEIQGQYASAWYNTKVDLTTNFTIKFDLNLGDRTGVGPFGGADGICFVLQTQCLSSGTTGSGLGYASEAPAFGITPAVAVEFDTYTNSDPNSNHAAIFKNGRNDHFDPTYLLASAYTFPYTLADGAYHQFTIEWNAGTQTLKVYNNTTQILTYTGDLLNNVFGGVQDVFWGFTGGTGESTNHHRVKMITYPSVSSSSSLTDVTILSGGSHVPTPAEGGASYLWSPSTGCSNVNIAQPTFTPTVTTTYYLTITDACGNQTFDDMVITIFGTSPLPVELTDFSAKCFDSYIELIWKTLSEENNDRFLIEKSMDGSTWSTIGSVNGQGNTTEKSDYSFIDNNNENAYYRLKQIDFDGKYEYSGIVFSHCNDNEFNFRVYPNPTDGVITCEINTDSGIKIQLINSLGEILYSVPFTSSAKTEIDLSTYSPGIYLMQVSDYQGKILQNEIIIRK